MITVIGKIAVRTLSGRFGPFNIGTLICDIGEFSIKDQILEELSEGSYDVQCVISHIKPNGFMMGNRFAVEIRADLYDIEILQDDADEANVPVVSEIDPAEEELVPEPIEKEIPQAPIATVVSENPTPDELSQLEELFGHLWPIGDSIKLDPTISRLDLRAQISYLKLQDFEYKASEQTWNKKPS